MAKSTFYFSVAVLFIVEFVQTGYQRKLAAERAATQNTPVHRVIGAVSSSIMS